MICDAADGDNCISGQKKVFGHFFSKCHRAKSIQIAEDHLPLCPVGFTRMQNKHFHKEAQSIHFIFPTDRVIM